MFFLFDLHAHFKRTIPDQLIQMAHVIFSSLMPHIFKDNNANIEIAIIASIFQHTFYGIGLTWKEFEFI